MGSGPNPFLLVGEFPRVPFVFGTLVAVVFIQGILVEGLRFLGDWRMILFGVLIILAMNFKPDGLFDNQSLRLIKQSLRFKS